MHELQHQFVKKILENASHGAFEKGYGFAPSNIALCKYWGKRDKILNLPQNSSLSISLGNKGTQTQIKRSSYDKFILNDQVLDSSSLFYQRLKTFLDLFRDSCRAPGFEVITKNNIPTSAGLASSASGYAALVLALNDLAGWDLPRQLLSMLARLGSGSASRSLFKGFAIWHCGQRDDGTDSFAESIDVTWSELRIGVITLTDNEKPVDSRSGMERTVETSNRYKGWPERARMDIETIYEAIKNKDFQILGSTSELNALEMHATMREATPPLDYFLPETRAQIDYVQQLRADGLPVYLTIDAGPNIKLLFKAEHQDDILLAFPSLEVINPFGVGDA